MSNQNNQNNQNNQRKDNQQKQKNSMFNAIAEALEQDEPGSSSALAEAASDTGTPGSQTSPTLPQPKDESRAAAPWQETKASSSPGMRELKDALDAAQAYSKEVQAFLIEVTAGCSRFELEKGYYEEYKKKLNLLRSRIKEAYLPMEVAVNWTYAHKDDPKTGDIKDQYNNKEKAFYEATKITDDVNAWLNAVASMMMKSIDQRP